MFQKRSGKCAGKRYFSKRGSSSTIASPNQPTLSRFFTAIRSTPGSAENISPPLASERLSQQVLTPIIIPKKAVLSEKVLSTLKKFQLEDPVERNHVLAVNTTAIKSLEVIEREQSPALPARNRKREEISATKLTPLEQQVVEIKEQYPETLLIIECGYKYRFFGKDADIAANELQLVAYKDHNFFTCSFPTHRLMVHARRLVSKGHLVGVVKQTETTALKAASERKSAPFKRELQALYTRSTLVEDVQSSDESESTQASYFVCLNEQKTGSSSVTFGLVGVRPATGDIIIDEFTDNLTRAELETRLSHISPSEIIIPTTAISDLTMKLLQFTQSYGASHGDFVRLERTDVFSYSDSLERLTSFYNDDPLSLERVVSLTNNVICSLGAALAYLERFKLKKCLADFRGLKHFTQSTDRVKIDGGTLRNLEIFQTSEGTENGSLFWLLDKTRTKFGSRLLRLWLSEPLRNINVLVQRQDAIHTLMSAHQRVEGGLKRVHSSLLKLPDLERLLASVLHKRVNPGQFYSLCKAFHTLLMTFTEARNAINQESQSCLVKTLFETIIPGLEDAGFFLALLDEESAKQGRKTSLFKDPTFYPKVEHRLCRIKALEHQLKDQRSSICKILRLPAFDFVTVAGQEYLIEVPNDRLIPSNWIKVSGTKQCGRFRSPEVEQLFGILCQHREKLEEGCQEAFGHLLGQYCEKYWQRKQAVHALAELDVLFALADVASQENYVRPELVNGSVPHLRIEQGRHPVVSFLMTGKVVQYVPNDTDLKSGGEQCMILTGPNMGGKSCYLRQVALIAYLAHIGSYVPARRASLTLNDAIWTRMGASDFIYAGRSTFLAEMQEASAILKEATPNSLAILDELGRGTATHDGTAIAWAVCSSLVEIGCLTLFVTHYPDLIALEQLNPRVANFHMGFLLDEHSDEELQQLVFLYSLVRGSANKSFGLNVALLAGFPTSVLVSARDAAQRLENFITFIKMATGRTKKLLMENIVK